MKKLSIILALFGLVVFGTACHKDEDSKPNIVKDINVTLKVNESYTYSLPANPTNLAISTPAKNGLVSEIQTSNSVGIYNYTPSKDFIGSDLVVLSGSSNETEDDNDKDNDDRKGRMPQKKCNHHNDNDDDDEMQKTIINIHFTIVSELTK